MTGERLWFVYSGACKHERYTACGSVKTGIGFMYEGDKGQGQWERETGMGPVGEEDWDRVVGRVGLGQGQ